MREKDVELTVTTGTGDVVRLPAALIPSDERFLLMHEEDIGFVAAVPVPLCRHGHERMEDAARCGLQTCQMIVNHKEAR